MGLEDKFNAIQRRYEHVRRHKDSMCRNPSIHVTYCSDYDSEICPRTCNYAREIMDKLAQFEGKVKK